MKLTRDKMIIFVLADTVLMGALWFFVIPGFLGNELAKPEMRLFYYYGLPIFWLTTQTYVVMATPPKK